MSVDVSKARFVRTAGVVVPFATAPVGDLPALTGKVRPATAAERGHFWDAEYAELKKAHGHEKALGTFYARHITAWDYYEDDTTAAGPLPITAETVASLPPAVFDQLGDVVMGVKLGN